MLVDWISARNGRFREAVAAFLKDNPGRLQKFAAPHAGTRFDQAPNGWTLPYRPGAAQSPRSSRWRALHLTRSRWRGRGGTKLSRWHGRGNTWRQSPASAIFRRRKAICVCSGSCSGSWLQTQIAFLRRKMVKAGL